MKHFYVERPKSTEKRSVEEIHLRRHTQEEKKTHHSNLAKDEKRSSRESLNVGSSNGSSKSPKSSPKPKHKTVYVVPVKGKLYKI